MPYVRCDVNCNKLPFGGREAPTNVNRVDVYGNTYDDWCGDFEAKDVNNQTPTWNHSTFLCEDYEVVEWLHLDKDGNPRTLKPYEKNVSVFDTIYPSPSDPIVVDELDLYFEIIHNNESFVLVNEGGYNDSRYNRVFIPELNTDYKIIPTKIVHTESNDLSIDLGNSSILNTES